MARSKLPTIDFGIQAGEITKATQDRVVRGALLVSQNADGMRELGAWGQVPGSTRVSNHANAAWESLHYYEHYTYAGTLTRDVIGLAGSGLYKINSDKSLQILKRYLNPEPMSSVTTLDRIHLVSPQNDPIKFDGELVTRWGVKAPGTEKTVLETFDDEANFIFLGANHVKSNVTGVESTDGAVRVDKTNTTISYAWLQRSGLSWDLSTAATSTLYVTLLVPEGGCERLLDSGTCVSVSLSDGAATDTWTFSVGELVEGRNLLSLDLDNPDEDNGADHTAITLARYYFAFNGASQVLDGFIWDDLYYLDDAQVTPSDNGTGAVTGVVTYRVTYVSKYGQESNAGVASAAFDAGDDGMKISVGDVPVSPDPQVVARRLYRDLDGDSLWLYVGQVDDNKTKTFSDNVSNGAKGSAPPLAADVSKDYSPPRRMQQVVEWEGYLFGIDAQNRFQININYKGRPEAWPVARQWQFEQEIVALIPWANGLIAASTDKCHLLEGREYNEFRFREIFPTESIGCAGWRAWLPVKTTACVWHDAGPFGIDMDPWYIAMPIRDQIEALDAESFRDIHMVHDRFWFRMLFFVQSTSGGDYDTIKVYSYGQGGESVSATETGIDPLDLRNGRWSRIVLPTGMNPKCSAIVERGGDQPQCWIGCDDGYIYWLGDPDSINYATGYSSSAISTSLETSWVRLESGVNMRPRFVNVSGTATYASTWAVLLQTSDEPDPESADIISTKLFSIVMGPGSTSHEIPVPAPCYGDYLKLTLTNALVNQDGLFRDISVEVIPRRVRRAA